MAVLYMHTDVPMIHAHQALMSYVGTLPLLADGGRGGRGSRERKRSSCRKADPSEKPTKSLDFTKEKEAAQKKGIKVQERRGE